VGFDNGDDLGMKGGDSAMPIWADFMKEALERNPQWMGDWPMPAGVRKAEIDIRDGTVIRELDPAEPIAATEKPDADKRNTGPAGENGLPLEAQPPAGDEMVKNVPAEFRRVELFINGTIPTKMTLPTEVNQETVPYDQVEITEPTPSPTPDAPPISGTWQDSQEPPENRNSVSRARPYGEDRRMVVVNICPLTGMRATAKCPEKEARAFRAGTEPKEFCTFHR
jgi:hypothetical protein